MIRMLAPYLCNYHKLRALTCAHRLRRTLFHPATVELNESTDFEGSPSFVLRLIISTTFDAVGIHGRRRGGSKLSSSTHPCCPCIEANNHMTSMECGSPALARSVLHNMIDVTQHCRRCAAIMRGLMAMQFMRRGPTHDI